MPSSVVRERGEAGRRKLDFPGGRGCGSFKPLTGVPDVQNLERKWKKVELFLGLFFGTFLIAAGGIWLRNNWEWLTHLRDSKATVFAAPRVPANPTPPMPNPVPSFTSIPEVSKFGINMTKFNVPSPQFQIPQIRTPYIPPPPRIPYIPPPPPPMGFRR